MSKPYNPQDRYFLKAKQEGYRARSAYKLREILEKFPQLLPKSGAVLDLGSAPGSFLQVLQQKLPRGIIVGVDLQEIEPFPSERKLHILTGDVFSAEIVAQIKELLPFQVDLITSDLAPKTMGVPDVDQWHSVELNEQVLQICSEVLRPGGSLITKIFVGEDFQEFWKDKFQKAFQKTRTFKPDASRDRSFETFLIGEGYKGN
jgi:23S rRNA (uridine2552-2'-O)-methyltransferase